MTALSSQQWVIAFRWNYNGLLINKKISKQEATRDNLNGAIIRIGRDQSSCNLHLENRSVSSQHAEIYFHEEEQKFFIKSLQHKNTSKIDGQDLVYGQELPLKQNSTIVLGLQKIQVTDIQIYQLEPTNYLAIANPNPTPVNPNSNSIPVNLNVNLTSEDPRSDSNKSKHWWQNPTISAAIIGAIATITAGIVTSYNNQQTRSTENHKAPVQKENQINKTYITTLATKQEKAKERYYKHKDENSKLQKEEGNFQEITFYSECNIPIKFAINFTALNDIQETRGWFRVTREQPMRLLNITKYGIFLYAYTEDNQQQFKQGQVTRQKYILSRDFDYIDDDITILYPPSRKEGEKDNLRKEYFYFVNLGKDYSITKTFNCDDGDSLKLN